MQQGWQIQQQAVLRTQEHIVLHTELETQLLNNPQALGMVKRGK